MKLFGAFKNLFQWLKKNKGKVYAVAILLQPQIVTQLAYLVVSQSDGKITQDKARLFAEAATVDVLRVLGGETVKSISESVLDMKLADNDTKTRLVAIAKDKANLDDVTANLAATILISKVKNLL